MTEFTYDRRTFLRRGAMGAGALWALSLDPFMARRAEGAAHPQPVRTRSARRSTRRPACRCSSCPTDSATCRTAGPAT